MNSCVPRKELVKLQSVISAPASRAGGPRIPDQGWTLRPPSLKLRTGRRACPCQTKHRPARTTSEYLRAKLELMLFESLVMKVRSGGLMLCPPKPWRRRALLRYAGVNTGSGANWKNPSFYYHSGSAPRRPRDGRHRGDIEARRL